MYGNACKAQKRRKHSPLRILASTGDEYELMAQATTNAAIEAGLHTAITREAKENGCSFSEQVSRYRALAHIKIHEELKAKSARIEENRQQKIRREAHQET